MNLFFYPDHSEILEIEIQVSSQDRKIDSSVCFWGKVTAQQYWHGIEPLV